MLLPATEEGGFELALRTDALLVRMRSDAVTGDAGNLAGSEADTSRLRLLLEGSRRLPVGDGATLAPSLNIGFRRDGGDAETGTGIELGGGLRFADPDLGLTADAKTRVLVAHEVSDFSEWGFGGSVRLDPGASGRGLSLTLAPGWGVASDGTERLWSLDGARGLAAHEAFGSAGRLDAEAGYGLAAFEGHGTVTPFAGFTVSGPGHRRVRTGVRWAAGPEVAFGVEGSRRKRADDVAPDHGIGLWASLRW